jgi:iron(II)-dependent oxidoreductase
MMGNVWEWTATAFLPWPGYVMDYPYREQSAPWFGSHKVARGGCFATPDVVLRGGEYRSFYHPSERTEVAVGFRTCAR